MRFSVAVQMDPPERLNAAGDSTIVLMEEAQARGHLLYYYHPASLSWSQGTLTAQAFPIILNTGAAQWYTLGEEQTLDLSRMDAVLMRQDPPYDMGYLHATYLLSRLRGRALVVNDPCAVRNLPEKLFPLDFAKYMPPTLVSADPQRIEEFMHAHQDIIIKPLYGHGGHGVFRLRPDSENLRPLLELLHASGKGPFVAQKFLPEVKEHDVRVILINGRVEGAIGRLPAAGEVRSNMRVGGTPCTVELSAKQRVICEEVGLACADHGIVFAGLDLIGDWLTEINVTSPTGLRAVKNLYGTTPEAAFWDAVERKAMNPGIIAEPIV